MAFLDAAALARDPAFQDRVQIAVLKIAANVAAEAADSQPTYDAYVRRANLATNILNVPQAHRESWAWAIVSGGIITSGSTDSDIEYTVTTLFDHMAGVIEPQPEPAA